MKSRYESTQGNIYECICDKEKEDFLLSLKDYLIISRCISLVLGTWQSLILLF